MAKTKNIITRWLISLVGMVWCVLWAKVTFQPVYSDVRFQPADKLHAGCINSADILFSPEGQKISKFRLVFYYNPDTVEILRILPNTKNGVVSSQIEYNKIVLDVQNPIFWSTKQATSFFQLYFKSDIVGQETLTLGTGSEVVAGDTTTPLTEIFTLDFAKVLECEPDIVPPSINLIYPKDTQKRIGLDQYFIFDIKDIGKWIDKNSVIINFDGEQYFYGSDNLKRNGNYLTFYPSKWIPIDMHMDLKILITDKQSYGWANTTQSTYSFQTATGMVFIKDVNPMMFRRITQEAEKISASASECALLSNIYNTSEVLYQKDIKSIIQKAGCDLAAVNISPSDSNQNLTTETPKGNKYRNISVFAALGWILFFVTFTLKLHYILSYRKHKRLAQNRQ